MAQVGEFVESQADGQRELTPGLDAAGIVAVAVMIEDALHPLPAHLAFGTVGEDRGVLDRYRDLIVVAIGDPAANLLGVALPEFSMTLNG